MQGSKNRLVRGPIGPSWSEIFEILLVLVRVGPRFHINSGPGPSRSVIFRKYLVLDYSIFFGPGPIGFGPWIPGLMLKILYKA